MRKAISALLLVSLASGVQAEWIKTVSGDGLDIYVAPETIRQEGRKIKLWELYSYDSPQVENGKRYLSLKIQNEYDCKEIRVRSLAGVGHAKKMGDGDVRFTDNEPSKWMPVVPDSLGEAIWKLICEEKRS